MIDRIRPRWTIRHLAILVLIAALLMAMVREPILLICGIAGLSGVLALDTGRAFYRDMLNDPPGRFGRIDPEGKARPRTWFDRAYAAFWGAFFAALAFAFAAFAMGMIVLGLGLMSRGIVNALRWNLWW